MKVMQSCFVIETVGPERHSSGSEHHTRRRAETESALTSGDISLLVVDRLYNQATGQSTAVTCFDFDFIARKEQFVTGFLGETGRQWN